MAKGKRKVPGINASSTADISFILFIFFLITTSMDTDRGLARRLPPPPENTENQEDVIVRERNDTSRKYCNWIFCIPPNRNITIIIRTL